MIDSGMLKLLKILENHGSIGKDAALLLLRNLPCSRMHRDFRCRMQKSALARLDEALPDRTIDLVPVIALDIGASLSSRSTKQVALQFIR